MAIRGRFIRETGPYNSLLGAPKPASAPPPSTPWGQGGVNLLVSGNEGNNDPIEDDEGNICNVVFITRQFASIFLF